MSKAQPCRLTSGETLLSWTVELFVFVRRMEDK